MTTYLQVVPHISCSEFFSLPRYVHALALYLTAFERHGMDVTCFHGREPHSVSHWVGEGKL